MKDKISFRIGKADTPLSGLVKNLDKFHQDLETMNSRLLSDITTRTPSRISKAVSENYEVGTLKAIKRYQFIGDGKRVLSERGNTKVESRREGDDLVLEFTGTRFSDWPVWAKGRQVVPKFVKVRGSKRKGTKTKRIRHHYAVTREVVTGKVIELQPKNDSRIFVLGENNHLKPYIMAPGWKRPRVMGSTSIPEAIVQPRTVEVWRPRVIELISERRDHHLDQLAKKYDKKKS